LLCTNLDNYAMPLIRYDTGDIGVLSNESCSCGRNLSSLKKIVGRKCDNIITPKGNIIFSLFFPTLIGKMNSISEFQVIQEIPEKVTLKIIKNKRFKKRDITHIEREVAKASENDLKIDFEFVDSIPLTKNGKRRYVISNCSI